MADLQLQQFESRAFNDVFYNGFLSLSVAQGQKISIALIGEFTTDITFTDQPRTFEIEEGPRYWLGSQITGTVAGRHRLSLFFGARRGGPACTSGICYEVQDFSGAEFRYTVNF
jgi:hypothetical protein